MRRKYLQWVVAAGLTGCIGPADYNPGRSLEVPRVEKADPRTEWFNTRLARLVRCFENPPDPVAVRKLREVLEPIPVGASIHEVVDLLVSNGFGDGIAGRSGTINSGVITVILDSKHTFYLYDKTAAHRWVYVGFTVETKK